MKHNAYFLQQGSVPALCFGDTAYILQGGPATKVF